MDFNLMEIKDINAEINQLVASVEQQLIIEYMRAENSNNYD